MPAGRCCANTSLSWPRFTRSARSSSTGPSRPWIASPYSPRRSANSTRYRCATGQRRAMNSTHVASASASEALTPVSNEELRRASRLSRKEDGNDRTDAADLGPCPPVHRLDLGFGDRRREAATGQNSMAGSGDGGRLVARGSRRQRQISGRLLGARLRLAALRVRAQSLPPIPDRD